MSDSIIIDIEFKFSQLQPLVNAKKALYFIWRKPYMCAGSHTFISDMMRFAGFENVINTPRYPELNEDDLKATNAEVVLLSSEPYPFNQKHIEELKEYFPKAPIILVDGEMFSWYGSRMLKAIDYFNQIRKGIY